jgi:cytochrome c-type biogenesis protein CcmH
MIKLLTCLILSLFICHTVGQINAYASTLPPEAVLDDPALEARARDLARQIRCVVCTGQSIADSEATLAIDMQLLIRQQLQQGMSDAQILAELRRRYGDNILLDPPVTVRTWLLWLLPALLPLVALVALAMRRRRGKPDEKIEPLAIDDWRGDRQEDQRT